MIVHFQKGRKKRVPFFHVKSASRWIEVHSKWSSPVSPKTLHKQQICKRGSPTPFRAHPSHGPWELFGPKTKSSPRNTRSYIIYVHATQRGGGERSQYYSAGSLRINTTRLESKPAKSSSSPTHARMHTHLLQAENQAQCSHVNCVHKIHCKPTTAVEAAAQGLKLNTMHSSHNT